MHTSYNDSRELPKEEQIVSRLLIDLNGYDTGFLKKCEEIFEINRYLDGSQAKMLWTWMDITISEIIALYSINPMTLMGTINIGADYRAYEEDMRRYSEEQFEEFNLAYKAFATNVYQHLSVRLERYVNQAIELGYSDIACSVGRYRENALLLNVRGIQPFSTTPVRTRTTKY